MKREIARNQSRGIHVNEGADHAASGESNKPSEIPKFLKGRETLIRDPQSEFNSPKDRTDREPPSQDMFESLTQAVTMIKRWG